jgi:hypothetical protein
MLGLPDIRDSLRSQLQSAVGIPSHVLAFSGWITQDTAMLQAAIDEAMAFDGQARRPEHVAALGYGAQAALLSAQTRQILLEKSGILVVDPFFLPVAHRDLKLMESRCWVCR